MPGVVVVGVLVLPGIGGRLSGGGKALSPLRLQPRDYVVEPGTAYQIREYKWPIAPHAPRVTLHDFERRPYVGRQIYLI